MSLQAKSQPGTNLTGENAKSGLSSWEARELIFHIPTSVNHCLAGVRGSV